MIDLFISLDEMGDNGESAEDYEAGCERMSAYLSQKHAPHNVCVNYVGNTDEYLDRVDIDDVDYIQAGTTDESERIDFAADVAGWLQDAWERVWCGGWQPAPDKRGGASICQ